MRKLYRPYLPREAVARGVLELVSLRRRLRKIPTDSSSSPSEEGCMGTAAKASFHHRYYLPLMRSSTFVDLQYSGVELRSIFPLSFFINNVGLPIVLHSLEP